MALQRLIISTSDFVNNFLRLLWPKRSRKLKITSTPPYNHFTQIGDPVLRQRAETVPLEKIDSPEIAEVIKHMVQVLRHCDCVGVAAPQIGVPFRIIAMEFREGKRQQFSTETYAERKMSTLPLTVLINPEMEITSTKLEKHPEGCMSVRGYTAEVERFERVKLKGIGQMGTPIEMDLDGWNARIAQHEMDHLDGTIYIDRMDISTFTSLVWKDVNANGGQCTTIRFDR